MKIKIGIVPTIREIYKNQFEFTMDLKWTVFLKKIFPKCQIRILTQNNKKEKIDLIILTGGNDLAKFAKSKKDIIRKKIDTYYYNLSKKKKIPIIGICYGATFIAEKFRCKIEKKLGHVGRHKIILKKSGHLKNSAKNNTVNSYHNYAITSVTNEFEVIAKSTDNTYELIEHKQKKIMCIMWHPERNKQISKLDIKLFKNFLCN